MKEILETAFVLAAMGVWYIVLPVFGCWVIISAIKSFFVGIGVEISTKTQAQSRTILPVVEESEEERLEKSHTLYVALHTENGPYNWSADWGPEGETAEDYGSVEEYNRAFAYLAKVAQSHTAPARLS